jgi:hypothetical protein
MDWLTILIISLIVLFVVGSGLGLIFVWLRKGPNDFVVTR